MKKFLLLLPLLLLFCHPPQPICDYVGTTKGVIVTPVSWDNRGSQTQISTDMGLVIIRGNPEIHLSDSLFICYDKEWGQRIRIGDKYYEILEKYIRVVY